MRLIALKDFIEPEEPLSAHGKLFQGIRMWTYVFISFIKSNNTPQAQTKRDCIAGARKSF
jgi:hypothetical protein